MKAQNENEFVPRWFTLPWDSGGYDPSSVVWSMVQSELDLDKDGKKEFLLTTTWSGDYHNMVYLYEAVANDSFQLVWWYSFYPYSNDFSAVTVSDLNNNGRQEILCLIDPSDTTYHGFYVFEWDGSDNGFPTLPTTTWDFGLGHWFHEGTAILADDMDNDGRQEVAVSFVESWDTYKSKVMIFSLQNDSLVNPSWQIEFVDSTTFPVVGYSLKTTDLDKDNQKELVVAGWDTLRIAIYENTGNANGYTLSANIKNLSSYLDVVNDGFVEANFDNNGTNELYMLTANGALFVATNNGDVSQMTAADFVWIAQYDVYNGMVGMAKADLDTNGIPELYLAGSYNEAVFRSEYLGGAVNDYNNYSYSTVFMDDTTDDRTSGDDQGYFRPTKIATGDFDSDGIPDMVVSSASYASDKPMLMFIEKDASSTVNVKAGWNIVSLPKTVSDASTANLFPTAKSSAFAFTQSGYAQRDSLNNGSGYWLKFSADESVSIDGIRRFDDTLDLFEGWNMVGSLSSTFGFASVATLPENLITSSLFGYDNGYSVSDSIQPGKGYWVKMQQAGKLILHASSSSNQTVKSLADVNINRHEIQLERKSFIRGKRTK